jgi:hypothetical protein
MLSLTNHSKVSLGQMLLLCALAPPPSCSYLVTKIKERAGNLFITMGIISLSFPWGKKKKTKKEEIKIT